MALSDERPGANVPVPPVQFPPDAAPLTKPASWTCGLDEHTTASAPASATATGLIVTCRASFPAPHGPGGSFGVSVSVTPPAAISAALGVYTAPGVEALGL